MAVGRYQVVCVGMWRGKIKRWNTTFHAGTGAGFVDALYGKMQKAGYPNPGDAVGACSGGVASITVYALSGGQPIEQEIYFDWETPSSWIPYTGEAWAAVDPLTPIDASGESAAVVMGYMGLSSTSKPVYTRKYLHAIPSRTASAYGDPDIDATTQAALEALFPTGWMSNPSGVAAQSVECSPWYLNHQRVRGRRRTTDQVVAQSFSAGVVAGATSGGGASAPQFQ